MNNTLTTLNTEGQSLLDSHEWRKAEKHFKQALSIHADHSDFALGLAIALYYLLKNTDALMAAQMAIDLNHKGGQAYYWLAMIKLSISKEAKTNLEEAIARSEEPTAFQYFLMGEILQKVSPRDYIKAEEYFSKVIENPPNQDMLAKALCNRSTSLIERGRFNLAQDDILLAQVCSAKYEKLYESAQRYLDAEIKKFKFIANSSASG